MSKNLTALCVRLSHFLEKYDFMQYSAWELRQDYGKVLYYMFVYKQNVDKVMRLKFSKI